MHKSFKSLSEVISKENAFEKVRQKAQEYDVVVSFVKIFPDLQKVAAAVKVEKQTLFLKVENSVWRSELNYKQKEIVDRINGFYKKNVIKAIKFSNR
ncbi:MAG: DUF721 domain-containing protein [Bacteroidetes bacterium]|nr:DUF721 domain-containing protein [Bacteroidota bacterium]MBU2508588.1 DUF721 domain-containing protein [Bacteroidota bacterium]